MALGEECLLVGDGALRYADVLRRRRPASRSATVGLAYPSAALARASWPTPGPCARSSCSRGSSSRCTCASPTPRSTGTRRRAARLMAARGARRPLDPTTLEVPLVPMRRRHLRGGAAHRGAGVPAAVVARPVHERARRCGPAASYLVARVDGTVVGYAGLMLTGDDGHVTTIAVDPGVAPPQDRHPAAARAGPRGDRARGARTSRSRCGSSNDGAQAHVPALRLRARPASARTTTSRRTRMPW